MCELLTGNTKSICEEPSGVVEWYASSIQNVALVADNNQKITAITMVTGKTFFPIKIDVETSTFTDVSTNERTAGIGRTQTATVVLKGYDETDTTFIEQLESTRVILIAKKSNGKYVALFVDNGGVATSSIDAGTTFDSFGGYTLTLVGKETKAARVVDASVIATII